MMGPRDYGIHLNIHGGAIAMAQIRAPSMTVLLGETVCSIGYCTSQRRCSCPTNGRLKDNAHNMGLNIAHCDGHATWYGFRVIHDNVTNPGPWYP
jgi:prepilin-type processing-associated H-X9-DG protein